MSDAGEFSRSAQTPGEDEFLSNLSHRPEGDDGSVIPPFLDEPQVALAAEPEGTEGGAGRVSATLKVLGRAVLNRVRKRSPINYVGDVHEPVASEGADEDGLQLSDRRSLKAAGAILGLLAGGTLPRRGHRLHLAIEGIDGTGKSTALTNVETLLRENGLTVSTVRYTNKSGAMGKLISSLYSQPEERSGTMNTLAGFRPLQAILYAINGRINLLKRQKGTDVLLADRSVLSGYASHVGRVPNWLLDAAESTYAPDIVAYLDLPLEEASNRIGIREEGAPGYEEDAASLLQFRNDYERVFANPPRRLRRTILERVDATQDRSEVASAIAAIALDRLASS